MMAKRQNAPIEPEPAYKSFVGLSFKVDPDFARRFQLVALAQGLTAKALLEDSFALYAQKHGNKVAAALLKAEKPVSPKGTRRRRT